MPLESLTLEDFQAHKKTVIPLDKGVNTIVGPSDTGKSAIIRALSWVCRNRPFGDSFIRKGAKSVCVTLEFDSSVLVRSKGGKENAYNLNSDEFVAFGAGVPDPVADALKVGDLNFQMQHDAPFWFADTGGTISRNLNSIVDLTIIDTVLGYVAAQRKRALASIEDAKERLSTHKQRKEELAWVVDMDASLKVLEQTDAQLTQDKRDRELLLDLIERAVGRRRAAKVLRAQCNMIQEVVELAQHHMDTLGAWKRLSSAVNEVREAAARKRRAFPTKAYQVLCTRADAAVNARQASDSLAQDIQHMRDLYKQRKLAREAYEKEHAAYHEQLGGVCPVCGGEYHA